MNEKKTIEKQNIKEESLNVAKKNLTVVRVEKSFP